MSAAESKISEILRVCHQQEMNKFSHPGAEGNGFYSPPRYRDNNNTSNNSNMSSSVEFNSPTSPYSNYLASRGFQASRGGGNQSHLAGPPAMMGTSLDVSHNSVTSQGSGPPMLPHHYTQMPPPHLGIFLVVCCHVSWNNSADTRADKRPLLVHLIVFSNFRH